VVFHCAERCRDSADRQSTLSPWCHVNSLCLGHLQASTISQSPRTPQGRREFITLPAQGLNDRFSVLPGTLTSMASVNTSLKSQCQLFFRR